MRHDDPVVLSDKALCERRLNDVMGSLLYLFLTSNRNIGNCLHYIWEFRPTLSIFYLEMSGMFILKSFLSQYKL